MANDYEPCDRCGGTIYTPNPSAHVCIAEDPNAAPPSSDAAQPEWQTITDADRKLYPHHTDGAIQGMKLVAGIPTKELVVLLKDATKREALRLRLGESTNPNWIDGQVAEELYNRGEIDEEGLDRGCSDDVPPSDAAQPDAFMPSVARLQEALEAMREVDSCQDKPATIYCDHCFDNMTYAFFARLALAHPEDAPEGPREELKKAATLYIGALKRLAGGYRAQEAWQRIDAYNDSVNIQEERWHDALNRLMGDRTDG